MVTWYAGEFGDICHTANTYLTLLLKELGHHQQLIAVVITKWFAFVQVKYVLVLRNIPCNIAGDSSTFLSLTLVTVDEMAGFICANGLIWVLLAASNRGGTK